VVVGVVGAVVIGLTVVLTGMAGPAGAGAGGGGAEQQPTTTTVPETTTTTAEPGSVAAVAQAIAAAGWYADPDSVGDREQLSAVADRLGTGSGAMGFALLDDEPVGGSPAYAEQILDALPAQNEFLIRTVVVLSDADVGVVSDSWDDDAIDAALDETIDELRANPTDGLEALADALAGQDQGSDDGADDGGSSAVGLWILGAVGVAGAIAANRYFSGSGSGEWADGDDQGSSSGNSSYWNRRRQYRSVRSSSRSNRSASRRSRSSSRSSSRGRGGRRL
jgi:hypothetical protein